MEPLGGGGAAVDWLTLLAVIAAAVFFVLWMVERRKGNPQAERGSSLEILKSRYARGEIDRREFDEKRKDLL
jgi:putative membrane protein